MRHGLARRFWTGEQGQDLTEYALLLAFIVLGAVAIFMVNVNPMSTIWSQADGIVNQAAAQTKGS